MPRSFQSAFRSDFEAPRAANVVLIFLTFTSEFWNGSVRVVNDVVNYTLGGNVYIGYPFDIELLTDDDKPPKGKLTIQNVDRQIGASILQLVYAPTMLIQMYSSSDWHTTIDATSNSRLPLGTPTLEYQATNLTVLDVTVDAMTVVANFGWFDITKEFWPKNRATKDNTPGLYR